jgi:hypothetical protein
MVERAIIQAKLSELTDISNRVWKMGVYFLKSGDFENGEALFHRTDAITTKIIELTQDLWDLDPELVGEAFLPEVEVDL